MFKNINEYKVNDVVQFIENHKWIGCFGFINEIKDKRIMIGVPIPQKGIAYIFCNEHDIEYVGRSILINNNNKEEDN